MEDSILISIKKMLGAPEGYEAFDDQIIIHINSVFSVLSQLGVGNGKFTITGPDETWEDYLSQDDDVDIEDVKSYMYLKVKMIFDPPSSGTAAEAFKEHIREFEWRLNVESDDWNDNV